MFPRKRKKEESTEQIKFVMHVRWLHPQILCFHIPNGGKRSKSEAALLKKMGVESGIPDLFIAKSNSRFNGLFIEMKAEKGKPTAKQIVIRNKLKSERYEVLLCRNFSEAYEAFKVYLSDT